MAEAVRLASESAQAAGASRITSLRLRVGRLSGVVPEAMQFAWDVVRVGTLAADASLEIETVAAVGWCERCEAEFECADFLLGCPHCHQPAAVLRRGRELEITAVELLMDQTQTRTERTL